MSDPGKWHWIASQGACNQQTDPRSAEGADPENDAANPSTARDSMRQIPEATPSPAKSSPIHNSNARTAQPQIKPSSLGTTATPNGALMTTALQNENASNSIDSKSIPTLSSDDSQLRDDRRYKSAPTTKLCTWHQVCHNSAYTRPAVDILREVQGGFQGAEDSNLQRE